MAQAKVDIESAAAERPYASGQDADRERVFPAFRQWGYLEADLDPLGFLRSQSRPELRLEGTAAQAARRIYCASIGVEFMHISDPERRGWIAEQMEGPAPAPDHRRILERLIRAD